MYYTPPQRVKHLIEEERQRHDNNIKEIKVSCDCTIRVINGILKCTYCKSIYSLECYNKDFKALIKLTNKDTGQSYIWEDARKNLEHKTAILLELTKVLGTLPRSQFITTDMWGKVCT